MTFRPAEAAVAAHTALLNVIPSSAAANTQLRRQTATKEDVVSQADRAAERECGRAGD